MAKTQLFKLYSLLALLFLANYTYSQSPTSPAKGFNVFLENNATLTTNETDGAFALGGDLTIKGNYQVSTQDCSQFTVNGTKIGLLVGGKIDYNASSNGEIKVNSNRYVKIGDATGSKVWYQDQNGAYSNIKITEGNNYNSSSRIQIQTNAQNLGVSASNNPVIEGGLIDFTSAFQTMRSSSSSISQNTHNVQLTNPNGQSISSTNLPNQIKINLQNGINYFNITSTDLNNAGTITFNDQPSASKILVVNVDAQGSFNWNVWNQAGIGDQQGAYIFYNFYNTTYLNITGNSTLKGTVFAPFADINKTQNSANIDGQVIGKSLVHSGGEMHCQIFNSTISVTCNTADNTTAITSITEDETKTLSGTPAGGTWSIVSGGGSINGTTYTPDNINVNTDVTIRYTIAADGSCPSTTDDITFIVTPVCNVVADNTTTSTSITEDETKSLSGTPAGGTWSIVSGGGTINGTTYTPDDIITDTDVTIRYTIAADGSCPETTDDVTFTVTAICNPPVNTIPGTQTTQENTTRFSITSISVTDPDGNLAKVRLTVSNGTLNVIVRISGGRNPITVNGPGDITITGTERNINNYLRTLSYTPNTGYFGTDTLTVTSMDSCNTSLSDVDSFKIIVTPVCTTADNTTTTTSITEDETKALSGTPAGGTWSIVSGGGTINGTTYTPDNINVNTDVTIKYTIAADGSCAATTDDVTFTVTPVCNVTADNTTSTASITEGQTKTLAGNPTGGTWSIVSGGGTINGTTYTPDNINVNTDVTIRYTIAANGSCAATTDDVTFTVTKGNTCTESSPTAPALGFNIFTLESLGLETNETEGSVATGGDLTLLGNYQIATNDAGSFEVNNTKIGLLVGGKIIYQSGNALQVNQNTYIKIGDSQGSTVWYKDQNNAYAPIRVTPSSNYNSSPRIMLQTDSNTLNVSSTNNPVFESNLIDFASAFQTLEANAISLSQNANNAQLTNPNGQSISNTSLPNQVKINLQDGVNYLNITGSDLNSVDVFTYNNAPSATKTLVINVDAAGSFNWDVWNQAGVGQQNAPYIIYNFYNTTTLNIEGNSTIEGTVFAPFANINKSVNQSNIEGQVIGLSFIHSGGEVHSANFEPTITTCSPNNGVTPTAEFNINDNEQCLTGNEFIFNNTSNTGAANQPADPITYTWNFGDGTSSTLMNPTKTYTTPGVYNVILTATNTYGTDTQTTQITVYPNTTVLISNTNSTTGNNSVTKEFTLANFADFTNYSWSLSGQGTGLFPNQNVVDFTFTQPGVYNIVFTGTNNNGCIVESIFTVNILSDEVSGGNAGGVESESLGDAISKIYVKRKKESVPTNFIKSKKNLYSKAKLKAAQPYYGKGQTMLDMFPTELVAGNVANVTSPTDILDYTVADEVLSVDFSINGKTKGVVLGIKTSDKIYNHTKASCDRLRGAEILNIETVQLEGYNFLMQGIKQRNGIVEYAISFAIAKNNNDANYTIQTNWYVNHYIKFNDVYNFQVWSTNPKDTQKLVKDVLANLKSFNPVKQVEIQEVPKTYAAKISRDKSELLVLLRSTEKGLNTEISMEEIYSETANNLKHRYNPVNTELEQTLKINIADGYEYDGLVKVNGEIQDAFYHADGNWGLDYDSKYTEIKEYFVSNNFDREYNDEEHAINRNIKIKATSEYDYLGIYKALLPGNLSADYTEYNYVSFTAKGSGLMELALIKSSIENWKEQYRVMVDLTEEEQTYYVPFELFASIGSTEKIIADDLTTLNFTFLPVEANTKELDLTITDVKFAKTAPQDQTVKAIEKFENNFLTYPNPSKGNVNLLLFSTTDSNARITLTDITGKVIYTAPITLTAGKNELDYNFNIKPGVMFLKVSSSEVNYGTSKIIFR